MENWYRSSLASSFMFTEEWVSQPEGMKPKPLQAQALGSTDIRQQQAMLQNLRKVLPHCHRMVWDQVRYGGGSILHDNPPTQKGLQRYSLKEHSCLKHTKMAKLGVKVGNIMAFTCLGVGSRLSPEYASIPGSGRAGVSNYF